MRTLIIGFLLLAAGALPAAAATTPTQDTAAAAPAPSPLEPFDRFIAAVNKGDMKMAAAAFTASPSMIDEFPSYYWQGAGALSAWVNDFGAFSQASGQTDGQMHIDAPSYSVVGDTSAYYVVPAHYIYKDRGKPAVEDGTFAVVTTRDEAGWKIASWAWAGTTPK